MSSEKKTEMREQEEIQRVDATSHGRRALGEERHPGPHISAAAFAARRRCGDRLDATALRFES